MEDRPRLLSIALALAACALVLAGCGGGGKKASSSGPYGPRSSPVALSRCMRANGVPNFPDPIAGSGGEGFPGGLMEGSDGLLVVDGTSISGPAAKQAEKACGVYLPPSGPPPRLSAARQASLLAFARCMRAHGVPNFPDPSANGAAIFRPAKQAVAQSPALRQAASACGRSP